MVAMGRIRSRAFNLTATLLLLTSCAPFPGQRALNTGKQTTGDIASSGPVVVSANEARPGSFGAPNIGPPNVMGAAPGLEAAAAPVAAPTLSTSVTMGVRGAVFLPPSLLSDQGGSIISPNGGTIISPNGGTVVSNNGGQVISPNGSTIISPNGGTVVSNNGGQIISPNGGTIISPNGGTVVSNNGGQIISPNGGTIISPNGGTVIANNGAGFRLAQVPLRYANVTLTDAVGQPVKDASGEALVTQTDENGEYRFPVDVTGRNLVVRVTVPGQTQQLLGLLTSAGAEKPVVVDLSSSMSLLYILQKYVNGDASRLEKLQADTLRQAIVETDATLASGSVAVPQSLEPAGLIEKVEQVRAKNAEANHVFDAIKAQLIPIGITKEGDGLLGIVADLGALEGGLVSHRDGALIVFSQSRHTLWKVDSAGVVHTLVPSGAWGFTEQRASTTPVTLAGMAELDDGRLILADAYNHRILSVASDHTVKVIAGDGVPGFTGDNDSAANARINFPTGLTLAPDGAIVFADTGNHRIRRIGKDGVIRTLVGDNGDGDELDQAVPGGARLNDAQGLTYDATGRLYVADGGHHRVLEFSAEGVLARVMNDPGALRRPINVADSGQDLFVLDADFNQLLKISQGLDPGVNWYGRATSVTGTPTITGGALLTMDGMRIVVGSSGGQVLRGQPGETFSTLIAGGQALMGDRIQRGGGVAVDNKGALYVVDEAAGRVFIKEPDHTLRAIAGYADAYNLPESAFLPKDNARALAVPLKSPHGIAIDPATGEALVTVLGPKPAVCRITSAGGLKVEIPDFTVVTRLANGDIAPVSFLPNVLALDAAGTWYVGAIGGTVFRVVPGKSFRILNADVPHHSVVALKIDVADQLYWLDATTRKIWWSSANGPQVALDVESVLGAFLGKNDPTAFCFDVDGNWLITEGEHIYRVGRRDLRTVLIAGTGAPRFGGTTRDDSFNYVTDLVLTPAGDLCILDRDQVKVITLDQLHAIQ